MKTIYFLCGLPRCGNTLLSSILNQNPNVTATQKSIVTDVINTDVFAPWVNNLKNIQDVDGKSIYILYVKPDGNYEIINHLVDLSPF